MWEGGREGGREIKMDGGREGEREKERKEGGMVGFLSMAASLLSPLQEPLGGLEGGEALKGMKLLTPGPWYSTWSGSSLEPCLEGYIQDDVLPLHTPSG